MTSSAAQDAQVLQDRARQLARPAVPDRAWNERRQLLRFTCRGERFAVDMDVVHQVVALDGAARLPSAAAPLVALASLGDRVAPVIDLTRATSPAAVPTSSSFGVATSVQGNLLFLLADAVTEVVAHEQPPSEPRSAGGPPDDAVVSPRGDVLVDVAHVIEELLAEREGRTTGRRPTTRTRRRPT